MTLKFVLKLEPKFYKILFCNKSGKKCLKDFDFLKTIFLNLKKIKASKVPTATEFHKKTPYV